MFIKDCKNDDLINIAQASKITKTNSGDRYEIRFKLSAGDHIMSFESEKDRDNMFKAIESKLDPLSTIRLLVLGER